MQCPACGTTCKDDAKFCPSCGSALIERPVPVEKKVSKKALNVRDSFAFKATAQANIAAGEYRRASDYAAQVEYEYQSELKTLKRMRLWGKIIGFSFLLLLIWIQIVTITATANTHSLDIHSYIMGNLIMSPLMFAGGYSMGIGTVGMLRAMKRSSWFIFGSIAIMLMIVMLLFYVAFFAGPFYYLAQKKRVKKLKAELDAAQEQESLAYAAIH